jgi:restriction system protein
MFWLLLKKLLLDKPPKKYRLKYRPESRQIKTLQNYNKLPTGWDMDVLRNIDWKLLEDLCSAYLASKNWEVQQTEFGADGGIDIIFNSAKWAKPTPFGIIQCKARPNWLVPVSAIRELLGVMVDRKAELGIFITTGNFTQPAIDFATGKRIQLVNGQKFLNLILALSPEVQSALLEKHITHDYAVPTCPKCGKKMVERRRKSDGTPFWGCKSFPACRGTMPMRQLK